jgi:hypothetical protein
MDNNMIKIISRTAEVANGFAGAAFGRINDAVI